jgi:hypothetical protein
MANHRPAITIETRYAECGGQYGFPDNTALHADLGAAIERIVPDVTIIHRGLMPQLPDSTHLIEVRQLIVCVGTAVPIPHVVGILHPWLRGRVTPRYGSDDPYFVLIYNEEGNRLLTIIEQKETDNEARVTVVS